MKPNSEASHSSFRTQSGQNEHFIIVRAAARGSFEEQLKSVERHYAAVQKSLGITPDSAVFRRIFLSDILNQDPIACRSGLISEKNSGPVAVSVIQQPPLPGSKLALLAYHVESPGLSKERLSPHHVMIGKSGLRHLWSTGFSANANDDAPSSFDQTRRVFGNLVDILARQGENLKDSCIRTWIYLKDVDVFYRGMVEARRELFEKQGLTGDTHYIASTGIEGAGGGQFDLVHMDAYSVLGLAPKQVSYLNDFDRLCPTKNYNVTFERGTRVAYADRAHHFISGTASIDRDGKVLYAGDVLRQLDRTVDNVDALLKSGGASINDLKYMLVYLRDPTDFAGVDSRLQARFPNMPRLVVQGAVCRPGWLIEIEGIAIASNNDTNLPSYIESAKP